MGLKVLLIYGLLVILWGAWVRVSHSGDGCGQSWPLCAEELIPQTNAGKTWVEFLHRVTSGLYGIAVVAGLIFSWRAQGHGVSVTARQRVRFWASVTTVLMIVEALLGARLVLAGFVAQNQSFGRLLTMSLHQLNSLALMGSTFCWYWRVRHPETSRGLRKDEWFLIFGFFALAILGSWSALSSTLFPSQSLLQAFAQDFANDSPWPIRLRIFHPFFAVAWLTMMVHHWQRLEFKRLTLLWLGAGFFGLVMLLSLSPSWMKIGHLLLTHLLWLSLLWSFQKAPST